MSAATDLSSGSLPEAEFKHRHRWFLAIAVYFLLQMTLRVLISESVELDEAEQVLLTQGFAWGYGSQPPLYTWLQAGLFRFLGTGVLGLALLKNFLLAGLYLFTFAAAREMAGEDRTALAASASLLFLPQIAWESQRDLTHSVLATALAAATLYAAARIFRRGRTCDYLLFGLFAGLGVLGKYNFGVFLAALLFAGISLPEFRPRLKQPRILLSLLVLLLVTAGHLGWCLTHTGDLLRQAGTFHRQEMPSAWVDWVRGSWSLVRAVFLFAGPLAVIYLLLFFRRPASQPVGGSPSDSRRLLERILLAGILICFGLILGFRVTNFKDRWMQPILFSATVYFPFLVGRRLDRIRLRNLLAVAAGVALLVLLLVPGRVFFAAHSKGRSQLNASFSRLSESLRQEGFSGGNIAASDRWLGGNLRLNFPGSPVLVPELANPRPREGAPWLVVWNATRNGELPDKLQHLCGSLAGCRTLGTPRYVEAPSLYGDGVVRLGFLLVEPND